MPPPRLFSFYSAARAKSAKAPKKHVCRKCGRELGSAQALKYHEKPGRKRACKAAAAGSDEE
jgi:hypothetical protein